MKASSRLIPPIMFRYQLPSLWRRTLHHLPLKRSLPNALLSTRNLSSSFTYEQLSAPVSEETLSLGRNLIAGDRVALSRAITLIESTNPTHAVQAQHLLEMVLESRKEKAQQAGEDEVTSFRLGIAGPPGAGKSTFTEALGCYLLGKDHRVAVIAVDPSSTRNGGSILGDKTRMNELSKDKRAFVRPSPTSGILGGIAQHTNDVVLLCESAGYDIVIVETVGLGQSEVQVDYTVDMLMLLVPPAGGDELQGVKKGIMEVADIVVVNKADGDLQSAANHAATEYMHALQMMRRKHPDWRPRVKKCSALRNDKIDTVWDTILKFRKTMMANGGLQNKRLQQNQNWMWSQFYEYIKVLVKSDGSTLKMASILEHELSIGHNNPRKAAQTLLDTFLSTKHK
mmetsp:Transcript_8297/g.10795  ORF Transcript_8297/g.10795 Transcript_8297/m.10795 type:complete len:397 (+) Transcript_8297:274-1464(+)